MKGGDGQDSVSPEDSKASRLLWHCLTPVIQRPEERKPPIKGQLVPVLLLGPEHPTAVMSAAVLRTSSPPAGREQPTGLV